MEILVETFMAANEDLASQELILMVADAMLKDSSEFRPQIMDFDGNGYLNDGDMIHILIHWGMQANSDCYRNNPFAKFETFLQAHH